MCSWCEEVAGSPITGVICTLNQSWEKPSDIWRQQTSYSGLGSVTHTITHVKFGITQKSIKLCNRQWFKAIKFGLFIVQRNRAVKGRIWVKRSMGVKIVLRGQKWTLMVYKVWTFVMTSMIWRNKCWGLLLKHIGVNKSSTGLFWGIREFYSDMIYKSEYSLWHKQKTSSMVGRGRQEF